MGAGYYIHLGQGSLVMKTGRWVLQAFVIGKSCDEDWELGTSGISDREVL